VLLAVLAVALAPTGLAAQTVSPSTLDSIIKTFVPDGDDVGEEMCRGLAEVAAPV
jgi:hypothetical protein